MGSKKQLRAEINSLNEKLDLSEEQLVKLSEVSNRNLQMAQFHLEQVKVHTGEILMEDINYCVSLGQRITNYLMEGFKDDGE